MTKNDHLHTIVTILSHEALGSRSVRSLKTHQRLRTISECSPLIRSGKRPYEVPPSILLRRKLRANLKTRVTHLNDTPPASRERSLSESFCHEAVSQLNEIECIRPQESGLYDSSNGLGSYFYIEHDFLNKKDTGRIEKSKLLSEIFKALSIHSESEDQYQQCDDSSITLAWEQEDIDEMSKAHYPNQPVHHIDQRKCLLYLLGRIINLSERLMSFKPKFNGFKIISLCNSSDKIPIQSSTGAEEQPIIILHMGRTSRSVNMISKRFDPFRLNVYDILLENSSLLIIYPDTHKHMKISLADEGSLSTDSGELNVLLMPCYLPPEAETPEHIKSHNADEKSESSVTSVSLPDSEPSVEKIRNAPQVPDNRALCSSEETPISTIGDLKIELSNQNETNEDTSENSDEHDITAKACADDPSKTDDDHIGTEDDTKLSENSKSPTTKTETVNDKSTDNNEKIEAALPVPAENNNSSISRAHEESTGAGSIPFLQDHAY